MYQVGIYSPPLVGFMDAKAVVDLETNLQELVRAIESYRQKYRLQLDLV